jgi:pilus assembly protein CpaE
MTQMPPELFTSTMHNAALPEFALAFAQAGTAETLFAAVASMGNLSPLQGGLEDCAKALASSPYRLVFLDFSPSQIGRSATLAKQLASTRPELALVAVGNSAVADSVLSALRAGVRDFIDLSSAHLEAAAIVQKALATGHPVSTTSHGPAVRGKLVVLLGARTGVGTSCAAVNLALLAQRAYGAEGKTLLLDFGIPVADASLYLGQKKEFDLLQAINSQNRIDETFIASAFARHSSGFTLLPMPSQSERMREIAYSDALSLLDVMRGFFPLQIADLGGCGDPDFVAAMVRNADEVLLVSDPSVGAIVSARTLLQALAERGVIVSKLQLLLSKHDEALALTAADVAKRLGIQPMGELPQCHVPMLQAINQGRALAEVAPTEAYVQALESVWRRFEWMPESKPAASRFNQGLVKGLRSLMQRPS